MASSTGRAPEAVRSVRVCLSTRLEYHRAVWVLNRSTVAGIPRVPHQNSRRVRPLAERRYVVTVTPEPGKTYIA